MDLAIDRMTRGPRGRTERSDGRNETMGFKPVIKGRWVDRLAGMARESGRDANALLDELLTAALDGGGPPGMEAVRDAGAGAATATAKAAGVKDGSGNLSSVTGKELQRAAATASAATDPHESAQGRGMEAENAETNPLRVLPTIKRWASLADEEAPAKGRSEDARGSNANPKDAKRRALAAKYAAPTPRRR